MASIRRAGGLFRLRYALVLAGLVGLMLTAAACGSSSSSTSSDTSSETSESSSGGGGGESFEIAFVPGVAKNPFYDTIHEAMVEEAEKLNMTVNYQEPAEFAPASETTVLNAVLASKPDLLAVSPTDAKALRAPIQRFLDEGIPVITVDLELEDTNEISSVIAGENFQGGELAGESMGELIGGEGKVAVLNIAPGFPTLEDRVEGFEKGLEKTAPKAEVVTTEYPGPDPSQNDAKARSILLANPDLAGFYGVTEVNAEGAASAIKATGNDQVKITAFDATPAEVKLLESGQIQFLSAQDPRKEGRLAAQFAAKILNGESVPKEVRIDNIGVDPENASDPKVQEHFYTGGSSEG